MLFEPVHSTYVCLIHFQSLRACVSEVIQAIDDQLFKQEDLQKKKVPSPRSSSALTNPSAEILSPCTTTT